MRSVDSRAAAWAMSIALREAASRAPESSAAAGAGAGPIAAPATTPAVSSSVRRTGSVARALQRRLDVAHPGRHRPAGQRRRPLTLGDRAVVGARDPRLPVHGPEG